MNDIKYDYIEMKKKKTICLSLNTVLVITFISRIYHYFIHKNLWLDENLIAMAIYKTPLIDLLQGKYEYNQSCPLLFGLYNKILAIITNYSPSILYFIPTIVGILLILLIVKFCIQYDGILYAFICVAIISVCKMPLYYSTEFKQYIFEATATIFLLSNVIHDIQKQNIYIFFSKNTLYIFLLHC